MLQDKAKNSSNVPFPFRECKRFKWLQWVDENKPLQKADIPIVFSARYTYSNCINCVVEIISIIILLANNLKLVSAIFYQFFFFFYRMIALQKLWKMFLFHLNSSLLSRDIQIFVIFPLPFHTFQIQKNKWKWNNLWYHELACINLQV